MTDRMRKDGAGWRKKDKLNDGWGQSKITTGFAIANDPGDFTLTPEFIENCYLWSTKKY